MPGLSKNNILLLLWLFLQRPLQGQIGDCFNLLFLRTHSFVLTASSKACLWQAGKAMLVVYNHGSNSSVLLFNALISPKALISTTTCWKYSQKTTKNDTERLSGFPVSLQWSSGKIRLELRCLVFLQALSSLRINYLSVNHSWYLKLWVRAVNSFCHTTTWRLSARGQLTSNMVFTWERVRDVHSGTPL